jgi:hypothetical protein
MATAVRYQTTQLSSSTSVRYPPNIAESFISSIELVVNGTRVSFINDYDWCSFLHSLFVRVEDGSIDGWNQLVPETGPRLPANPDTTLSVLTHGDALGAYLGPNSLMPCTSGVIPSSVISDSLNSLVLGTPNTITVGDKTELRSSAPARHLSFAATFSSPRYTKATMLAIDGAATTNLDPQVYTDETDDGRMTDTSVLGSLTPSNIYYPNTVYNRMSRPFQHSFKPFLGYSSRYTLLPPYTSIQINVTMVQQTSTALFVGVDSNTPGSNLSSANVTPIVLDCYLTVPMHPGPVQYDYMTRISRFDSFYPTVQSCAAIPLGTTTASCVFNKPDGYSGAPLFMAVCFTQSTVSTNSRVKRYNSMRTHNYGSYDALTPGQTPVCYDMIRSMFHVASLQLTAPGQASLPTGGAYGDPMPSYNPANDPFAFTGDPRVRMAYEEMALALGGRVPLCTRFPPNYDANFNVSYPMWCFDVRDLEDTTTYNITFTFTSPCTHPLTVWVYIYGRKEITILPSVGTFVEIPPPLSLHPSPP